MTHDAIVIGAGPAGSTAARLLAGRGASVLLLDKSVFPRDKPCGGGVTVRAASALDIDLSPAVERTIYGTRFSLRLGPHFDRVSDRPLAYMTQRRDLDAFLAGQAAEAGADFHDGEGVREIEYPVGREPVKRPVTVRTDRSTYTARILIGADGANGLTGRATGLRPRCDEAVALEGVLPFVDDVPPDWRRHVALDLGGVAGGYGWVFPKGRCLNVGAGGWKYAGFTLRPKLAELCRRYGFDPATLEDVRGHHLPVRSPGAPVARGPVALVGDAAGLVDPLSGEGIHMAFASGRLAAESALACLAGETPDMTAYQRAVGRRLQPELGVSLQLQEIFNFAPPPYFALMRSNERFWRLFCHIIRGEMTYLDFVRMLGPLRHAVAFLGAVAHRHRLRKVAAGARLLTQARG